VMLFGGSNDDVGKSGDAALSSVEMLPSSLK
jgi:hypothetical protein